MYVGSRDNNLRAIAFDGPEPIELWRLNAGDVSPTMWNNDWDGAPMIIDDYLFEGGENSVFHVVRLNRSYDAAGMVTVDPELVFHAPGWDQDLVNILGRNQSIENSVAVSGNTVYFANSGGLVQGWDIADLAAGIDPTRVFTFWTGDDVDASVVVDDEGFLYVGVEWERFNSRAAEVGQVLKLDPSAEDPLVWSVDDQASGVSGIWATLAVHRDAVYVPTDGGRLLGIDRATGTIRWEKRLPGPLWQSPVVVDDVLLQGDCNGVLHAYDVSNTAVEPPELWQLQLTGCIESTPAVWGGRIFVGTREGTFYAIGNP